MNAVKATIQYSTIAESHKCIKIVHCVVYRTHKMVLHQLMSNEQVTCTDPCYHHLNSTLCVHCAILLWSEICIIYLRG